jgi:hypothetical protein
MWLRKKGRKFTRGEGCDGRMHAFLWQRLRGGDRCHKTGLGKLTLTCFMLECRKSYRAKYTPALSSVSAGYGLELRAED